MPYNTNDDLPNNVKKVLPSDAQTIFRKVFNSAYDQYGEEKIAFQTAWAAVKKQYEKRDSGWTKK